MKRSQAAAIKAVAGSCRLIVIETPTRDAICTDTGNDTTTLAYVAIGAEAWSSLFAAAPDLLEALRQIVDDPVLDSDTQRLLRARSVARAAIAKATGAA